MDIIDNINDKVNPKRIYHPYYKWEDYKNGFYENASGIEKDNFIKLALEMFNSEEKTILMMNLVITDWKYSCEHNLTNSSLNKIAYIGQAACCLYARIPNSVTMEAWSLLSNDVQERSNKIASDVLNKWESKNLNLYA